MLRWSDRRAITRRVRASVGPMSHWEGGHSMTRIFGRIAPWFLTLLAISYLSHSAMAQRRPTRPAANEASEPDAADDERDKSVMERFLGVLEKTPRRGTA